VKLLALVKGFHSDLGVEAWNDQEYQALIVGYSLAKVESIKQVGYSDHEIQICNR